MAPRIALCLEQTLGHRSHALNIERALERHPIDAEVHRIEYVERRYARVPWAVRGSRAARKALHRRSNRLDAIFYHTQTVSLFAPWTAESPYVVSVDATPVQIDTMAGWYRHAVGPGRLERAKRAWYRRVFAGAAAVVSWSEWARDSLAEHYDVDPARVLIAHPGAPGYLFDIPRDNVDRKPRILFVGGDLARKGGDTLLEAFAPLRDRAELTLMTEARVRPGSGVRVLDGVRPGMPAFRQAFANADIFCLPTRGDCTPVAIGEALAAGLPVVTTSVGSNPEIVRDSETGLLVSPGSVAELRDALSKLIDDAALRQEMGRKARADALERYCADANADRVLGLLQTVALRS